MADAANYGAIFRRLKLESNTANERYVAARLTLDDAIQNPIGVPGTDGGLRIRRAAQELKEALEANRKAVEKLAKFACSGEDPESSGSG